jgi:uncharacterized protein with HEPN domain
MSESHRLPDYLDHIQQAAADALDFAEGLTKEDFVADKRTQRAVIMSLIIVGEAATKVMEGYAEFIQAHPEVPWRSMRNMRNRTGTAALGRRRSASGRIRQSSRIS